MIANSLVVSQLHLDPEGVRVTILLGFGEQQ
jgi:hypothetical protein